MLKYVEILNLISLCQRKSSLWFHRTFAPFGQRFRESIARNPTRHISGLAWERCVSKVPTKNFQLYHRQSILYLPKKDRGCDAAEWQFRRDALVALLTQHRACLSLCCCCKGLKKQEIWLDASLFQYALGNPWNAYALSGLAGCTCSHFKLAVSS